MLDGGAGGGFDLAVVARVVARCGHIAAVEDGRWGVVGAVFVSADVAGGDGVAVAVERPCFAPLVGSGTGSVVSRIYGGAIGADGVGGGGAAVVAQSAQEWVGTGQIPCAAQVAGGIGGEIMAEGLPCAQTVALVVGRVVGHDGVVEPNGCPIGAANPAGRVGPLCDVKGDGAVAHGDGDVGRGGGEGDGGVVELGDVAAKGAVFDEDGEVVAADVDARPAVFGGVVVDGAVGEGEGVGDFDAAAVEAAVGDNGRLPHGGGAIEP